MNIFTCRVALRPRGPLEVFDLALELLRAHPGPFVKLALPLVGFPAALLAAGSLATGGHWAWLLLAFLLTPAIQAPYTVLGGRLLFAEQVPLTQVLRELVTRPLATASAVFWPSAMGVVGLLMCGVGPLFTLPLSAFVAEAALLERATGVDAVFRAAKLAMYSPLGSMVYCSVWFAGSAWGVVVGEATGQMLFDWLLQFGAPFSGLQEGVVTPYAVVGLLAVQPVLGLYRLLLFVDVRTRVDGWDLQVGLRAARLAADASGRVAS